MLHAALDGWQYRMAEILILYDADINAQNDDGDTPLHFLVRSKDIPFEGTFLHGEPPEEARRKSFRLIPLQKADIRIQNKQGANVLHLAAYSGDLFAVKELVLFSKVSLEDTTPEGITALGLAIIDEHLDCIDYLIKAGANIDAVLPGGKRLRDLLTFSDETNSTDVSPSA